MAFLGVAIQTVLLPSALTATTRFQVQEVLKGTVNGREILIRTTSLCRAHFTNGQNYLVYAYWDSSQQSLVTSMCSGNRHAEYAHAEVARLREFRSKGRIDGVTGSIYAPGPIAGIVVSAQSDAGVWKAVADDHGLFRFSGLPKIPYGIYTVTAAAPSGYTRQQRASIVAGCDAIELRTAGNASLSGKLISKTAPIPNDTLVSLAEPVTGRIIQQVRYPSTRPGGRFEFTQLSPGAYILHVDFPPDNGGASHFAPHARVYYPGVANPAQARPITVRPGLDAANLGIPLAISPTRSVDIAVARNGMLELASVSVQDVESHTEASLPVSTSGYKLNLFAGRVYRLVAYSLKDGNIQHSEPLIIGKEGNQIIELHIAHEGFEDRCPRCRSTKQ